VVWEDDSGTLGPLLREAVEAGVTMPEFEGNLLSLRQAIDREDPWLERKWLLYVPPLPPNVDTEWLVDYEQAFWHLPQANLSWAFHEFFDLPDTLETRGLLRGQAAARVALAFDRYVGEVDELSEEDVISALLRAAIGVAEADDPELVLRYLTSEADERAWEAAGLLPSVTALIKSRKRLALRRHLTDGQAPDRGALARCLLASSLVEVGAVDAKAVANHLPDPGTRPRWRKTLDHGLADPSRRATLTALIEQEIQVSELAQALDDPLRLASGPGLPLLDRKMQLLLHEAAIKQPTNQADWWARVREVADARLRQSHVDEASLRAWPVLRDAAHLLTLVGRRREELALYPADSLERLATEYAASSTGDWRIDALYRNIARDERGVLDELRRVLIEPAREAYHKWTRELTRRFAQAVEAEGSYASPTVLPQVRFWAEMVDKPGRVAALIVDALRADLAHDLSARLQTAGRQVEHRTVFATLPSRTEVCMAALLPRAENGFAVKVEQSRLMAYIGPVRLPSVNERTRYLESVAREQGKQVKRRSIGEFLAEDGKLLAECFREKQLPVAHTTDIDDGGEIAAKVSFSVFERVLDTCASFVDRALSLGFSEVVVAGDHGFLVRDPQAAPGGVSGTESAGGAFTRGLRYAAGIGTVGPEFLRLSASQLGRAGDDVYVPRDTSCLALQGGPGLFVHGGLSPQECALVFLSVLPGASRVVADLLPVSLRVRAKETSLTFKVHVVVSAVKQPLLVDPRAVVLKVEDEKGMAIVASDTLNLKASNSEQTTSLTVTATARGVFGVCLYDESSGRLLTKQTVQVEVLGDDFGF